MALVYRHRRLDTYEIFYVGIGKSIKRANQKSKTKRSKFWFNVVNKTDYVVEILVEDISWDEACELEKLLISEYGRRDLGLGNLVNLTDGGEDPPKNFGDKNYSRTEEGRRKISEFMKGRKTSTETKIKQSNSKKEKGIIPPSRKGKKNSKESILKQSLSISGSKHWSSKKVICIETNKLWGSIVECAVDNNLPKSSLAAKLNGTVKNNTSFRLL